MWKLRALRVTAVTLTALGFLVACVHTASHSLVASAAYKSTTQGITDPGLP